MARFNSISESLSHVIVGSRVDDHWKQLVLLAHKPHVVTAEWIVQSCAMKRAAPESLYVHPEFKPNAGNSDPCAGNNVARRSAVDTETEETQIVHQYLTTAESRESVVDAEPAGCFGGLTFQLAGTRPDFVQLMTELIAANGGRLVHADGRYVVADLGRSVCNEDAICVNSLWIEDCVDHEQLIDVEYYHRPVELPPAASSILHGCVVAQSGIEGPFSDSAHSISSSTYLT